MSIGLLDLEKIIPKIGLLMRFGVIYLEDDHGSWHSPISILAPASVEVTYSMPGRYDSFTVSEISWFTPGGKFTENKCQ